ncbi:MAG TPA: CaiB/BaiF CoA-transferase family protein [Candidatus Binataceae bacterium]|nr:CaiB/BaiF CoA-transferase family protein [Candidatus Binataceae bacterium]
MDDLNTEALLGSALEGITVLEVGDERGEFAAMLLGSLGAQVIKLEGPEGSASRQFGPFTTADHHPEHSLHFARYNLGKQSVSIGASGARANDVIRRLAATADVILDSGDAAEVAKRLEFHHELQIVNPRLVICTLTPCGLDGPFRDLKMTDLTHLALGGVMMSCGYDPNKEGVYDTPPIAPGMWQAYHIAGEHAVIAILGVLNARELTGEGDVIDVSIHEAVSTCTEVAMPTYIYAKAIVNRQTGRHAAETRTRPWLRRTKDGRYVKAFLFWSGHERRTIATMLTEAGVEHDLDSEAYRELVKNAPSEAARHFNAMVDKLAASLTAEELYHRAQAKGLLWASVRYPEENLGDPHFQARGSFAPINHPELGRDLYYPVSVATDGRDRAINIAGRAPQLGEHTREVLRRAGYTDQEIAALSRSGNA